MDCPVKFGRSWRAYGPPPPEKKSGLLRQERRVIRRLFNNINTATSVAMVEVCALLSSMLVICIIISISIMPAPS